jgi:hypothetical protein
MPNTQRCDLRKAANRAWNPQFMAILAMYITGRMPVPRRV